MDSAQTAAIQMTTTGLLECLMSFASASLGLCSASNFIRLRSFRNSGQADLAEARISFTHGNPGRLGVTYRMSTDGARQKANLHAIIGPEEVRGGERRWPWIPGDLPRRGLEQMEAHYGEMIEPAMKAVRPANGTDEILPAGHALIRKVKPVDSFNRAGNVAYGTESGFFGNPGIPKIMCGIGPARAHLPDEWSAEAEVMKCDDLIHGLAERLLV